MDKRPMKIEFPDGSFKWTYGNFINGELAAIGMGTYYTRRFCGLGKKARKNHASKCL